MKPRGCTAVTTKSGQPDETDERRFGSSWLFVLPWEIHHPGGVNQVVGNLFKEMGEKEKYLPILAISDWQYPKVECAKIDDRLTCHARLRSPWMERAPVKGLVGFLLELPKSIWQWRTFLRKNKTRVINIHYPTLDSFILLFMRWAHLYQGKVILSLHGTDLTNAGKSHGIERLVWKFIVAASDNVVVCSSNLGERFAFYFPRYRTKLVTIHNGVDTESLLQDQDKSFELEPRLMSIPYILNVGTFAPVKGQDILVQAFSHVAKKIADVRLVIIGRSDLAQSKIERLVRNLGLEERVSLFTDVPHERIGAFMRQASLFVLPSRSEGFPIVLLEAAVFNLPVVASNVGGIPEIIEHGVSGRLVEPEDAAQLASSIISLIDDKDECVRLGLALNSKTLSNFRWSDAYTKYARLAN